MLETVNVSAIPILAISEVPLLLAERHMMHGTCFHRTIPVLAVGTAHGFRYWRGTVDHARIE
jgi:hypothetical protein